MHCSHATAAAAAAPAAAALAFKQRLAISADLQLTLWCWHLLCRPQYDRATGFVAEDNSGRANIFPTKVTAGQAMHCKTLMHTHSIVACRMLQELLLHLNKEHMC
jgi:hypothetical protein